MIYVGKAASLRQRLSNYFGDPRNMHPRTAQMVATAESVEWTTVRNEVEALMLEYSLIKEHDPRFNVRLRDDKSYPFLAVTVDEQWPRALVMRGRKRKGTRYFGPYAHAYAIRDTLDELLRSFPIRTCSPAKFRQHERLGRPCLLFHIEKCTGPCVGEIDEMPYRQLVDELCDFLDGDTDADRQAPRRRDAGGGRRRWSSRRRPGCATAWPRCGGRSSASRWSPTATRTSTSSASPTTSWRRRCRCSTSARAGSSGARGSSLDKVEDAHAGRAGRPHPRARCTARTRRRACPSRCSCRSSRTTSTTYEEWLALQRGSRVQIRVPQRGDKRALLETVTRNAQEEFTRHRLRRASDHNTRSRALTELQEHLGLPEAPLRIECYDMAHLQGTDYVGSMVVLEDGLPNKREYRRFKVHVPGNDDYAAMEEVLTRRLDGVPRRARPAAAERGERPGKFAYPPQLLVVDGGKGQLGVAERVVRELGLERRDPRGRRWPSGSRRCTCPGRSEPVEIPRGSEALFMLQRIRDEAHRFANTFHGERRSKRMTASALDGIAGLGETRKKRLVKELGGVNAVKRAEPRASCRR